MLRTWLSTVRSEMNRRVVIYCTGYKISFPFLGDTTIGAGGGQIRLYHRVAAPELPGLYFIGLVQPIGAVMPIAEAQSAVGR